MNWLIASSVCLTVDSGSNCTVVISTRTSYLVYHNNWICPFTLRKMAGTAQKQLTIMNHLTSPMFFDGSVLFIFSVLYSSRWLLSVFVSILFLGHELSFFILFLSRLGICHLTKIHGEKLVQYKQ